MTATKGAPATSAVTALSEPAAEAPINAACHILALPTIRAEAVAIADASAKQRLTYKVFLAEILTAECDERHDRHSHRDHARCGPCERRGEGQAGNRHSAM